jgi:hypothetical protein
VKAEAEVEREIERGRLREKYIRIELPSTIIIGHSGVTAGGQVDTTTL